MRKKLIFRNIQQDHRKESWDQTKIVLANEIKKIWKILTMRLSLRKFKGRTVSKKTDLEEIHL